MQLSGKLVRDLIPTLMHKDKQHPRFRRLSPGERISHLRAKLVEECAELIEAGTRPAIIEELSDVKEVFDVLVKVLGLEASARIPSEYAAPTELSVERMRALCKTLLESAQALQKADVLRQYERAVAAFAAAYKALLPALWVSAEEIARRQKRKREAKGGFTKFYVLIGPA